jgi:hypothetical protein
MSRTLPVFSDDPSGQPEHIGKTLNVKKPATLVMSGLTQGLFPQSGTGVSRYVNSLYQFDKTSHKPPEPRYRHSHHNEQHIIGIPLGLQTIRILFGGGITGIV